MKGRVRLVLVCVALSVLPPLAGALPLGEAPLAIDHAYVSCVLEGHFPRLEARIDPATRVGRARAFFRPEGSPHWWAVPMRAEGGSFFGVLPKPTKDLKAFEYYIEATDQAFGVARTEDHRAEVVSVPSSCRPGAILAGAAGPTTLVLEAPSEAPAVPAGFSTAGVTVASVAAIGAAGTAGAAGIGGTALIVGGVAAAAAAAGVAVATSSDEPSSAGAAAPSQTLTGRWVGVVNEDLDGVTCADVFDATVDLTQSGGSVTGQMTLVLRSATAHAGFPQDQCYRPGWSYPMAAMTAGTISGSTVSLPFPAVDPRGGTWILSGTVAADWRSMGGDLLFTTPGYLPGTWSLARQ